jgi:hypothetical protein
MKSGTLHIALVTIIVTVLIIEETRINMLQSDLDNTIAIQTPGKTDSRASDRLLPKTRIITPATKSGRLEDPDKGSDQENRMTEIGTAMRKMADNPAAKAMFAQAHKGTALNIYGPLIEQLDLDDEEKDYFITLLAGEFAHQQEMGMKLMGIKMMQGMMNKDSQ